MIKVNLTNNDIVRAIKDLIELSYDTGLNELIVHERSGLSHL